MVYRYADSDRYLNTALAVQPIDHDVDYCDSLVVLLEFEFTKWVIFWEQAWSPSREFTDCSISTLKGDELYSIQ